MDYLVGVASGVNRRMVKEQPLWPGKPHRPPSFTRLLCSFPEVARYNGGDPNSTASFACVNEAWEPDRD